MLNPGQKLLNGQYRIQRQLGQGGFGFVYEARHTLLRKTVAIKELIPGLVGDQDQLKRFLAEARATLELSHDHIVRTFNVFSDLDNYYIVMECMAGGSLETHLREQGALPVDEAVRLAVEVCRGLAHAHQRGIVHCDLKPANILFTSDPARGTGGSVKVADFGIAHMPEQAFTRTWRTPQGFVAGTLPYMSPEQTEGVRDDPRVDVYALGAVLYRMLTGRTYLDFNERETPAAQAANVNLIQHQNPALPSAANRSVPDWLDAILMKALSKNPEGRYRGAEPLGTALATQTAPEPVAPAAAPPSPTPGPTLVSAPTSVSQLRSNLPPWFWPAAAATVTLFILVVCGLVLLLRGTGPGAETPSAPTEMAYDLPTETRPRLTSAPSPSSTTTLPATSEAASTQTYTVQEGDTLETIAARFQISLDALLTANGLTETSALQIGAKLMIPIPGSTPTIEVALLTATPSPTPTGTPFLTMTPGRTSTATSPPTSTPEPPTSSPKPAKPPTPTSSPVPAGPARGDTWTRPQDGMTMVFVPAGRFDMGSDDRELDRALDLCSQYGMECDRAWLADEKPIHRIVLDSFWIDRTEVTNAQFAAFLNAQGNQMEAGATWLDLGDEECLIEHSGDQFQSRPGYAAHPVVEVTWHGAAAFCRWVGSRLPTEAEWEYAARGPEGQRFPWGNGFSGSRLNYCDASCGGDAPDPTVNDGYGRTAPVGSYPSGSSWFGALDMAGNVWEWVADRYGPYLSSRQVNPLGPATGDYRIIRGGSWSDPPAGVRSAGRYKVSPIDAILNWGFRCARGSG